MPEERHAAEEHALLAEVTEPLSGLPPEPPVITPEPDFPIVLRGYDRFAVDAYVRRTGELLEDLRATRSPDAAVRRALERVGEQISGILQRAHDTAAEITTGSRREAEDRLIEARREAEERLTEARREAEEIVAAARTRLEEIDAETDRVWAERERIVEEVRGLAQELLELGGGSAGAAPEDQAGPELEADPAPVAADPERTVSLPPVFDVEEAEADARPHQEDPAGDADATSLLRRPDDPPA